MNITIRMDDADFEELIQGSMAWAAYWAAAVPAHEDTAWSAQVQAGRFQPVNGSEGEPQKDWAVAYWTGSDWAAVMLCRAFLDAKHRGYQVFWDEAGGNSDEGSYVILTGYLTPPVAKMIEKSGRKP
jgi:hypothetical protein